MSKYRLADDICSECGGKKRTDELYNSGHKMSCSQGERWQNKVTAPVEMLRKYGPPSEEH